MQVSFLWGNLIEYVFFYYYYLYYFQILEL